MRLRPIYEISQNLSTEKSSSQNHVYLIKQNPEIRDPADYVEWSINKAQMDAGSVWQGEEVREEEEHDMADGWF